MENSKRVLIEFLKNLGYEPEDIPESVEKKTADVRLRIDSEVYIFEAKGRNISAEYAEIQADPWGGSLGRIVEYSRRVINSIEEAHLQLITQQKNNSYLIVWYECSHRDSIRYEEIELTIYGSQDVNVFQLDPPKLIASKTCYFYWPGAFLSVPNIDAVFLSFLGREPGEHSLRVLLNPFSPRYKLIVESMLLNRLSAGVVDPIAQTDRGEAYLFDANVARSQDGQAQLRRLNEIESPHVVNPMGPTMVWSAVWSVGLRNDDLNQ